MADDLEWIRRGLARPGKTQTGLAQALNRSPSAVTQLLKGDRELKAREIDVIAGYLEVDAPGAPRSGVRPPPDFMGERDLPVYAAAEGGPGEMVVNTDPIELVPRPWYLKNVREGFAVLVTGDSMVPAFEPGDLAIVNPRLPPTRGKDVILVADETAGEFRASIKRLIRWTEQEWHLQQFNPPAAQKALFTLSRKGWPKALRVVGKYYGG